MKLIHVLCLAGFMLHSIANSDSSPDPDNKTGSNPQTNNSTHTTPSPTTTNTTATPSPTTTNTTATPSPTTTSTTATPLPTTTSTTTTPSPPPTKVSTPHSPKSLNTFTPSSSPTTSTSTSIAPSPTVTNIPIAPSPTVTNIPIAPSPTVTNISIAPSPTVTNIPIAPTPTVTNTPIAPTPTVTNIPIAPTPTATSTPIAPTPTVTSTSITSTSNTTQSRALSPGEPKRTTAKPRVTTYEAPILRNKELLSVNLNFSIKYIDKAFNASLEDKQSEYYKATAAKYEKKLLKTYQNASENFIDITVTGFRNGSLEVIFIVEYKPFTLRNNITIESALEKVKESFAADNKVDQEYLNDVFCKKAKEAVKEVKSFADHPCWIPSACENYRYCVDIDNDFYECKHKCYNVTCLHGGSCVIDKEYNATCRCVKQGDYLYTGKECRETVELLDIDRDTIIALSVGVGGVVIVSLLIVIVLLALKMRSKNEGPRFGNWYHANSLDKIINGALEPWEPDSGATFSHELSVQSGKDPQSIDPFTSPRAYTRKQAESRDPRYTGAPVSMEMMVQARRREVENHPDYVPNSVVRANDPHAYIEIDDDNNSKAIMYQPTRAAHLPAERLLRKDRPSSGPRVHDYSSNYAAQRIPVAGPRGGAK